MSPIENLNWRYATKRMDRKTVPPEKVDYVLEVARLALSSSGLQPYGIVVINNLEMLKKLWKGGHTY
jgi:nitroreductase / dihydropteridine reductase